MSDRPNILFICTDQQSATMMSCTGNRWLKTPAMDSLAARGVRFDHAYCTVPVCIASRFSLFTGRMPTEINLRDNEAWRDDVVVTDHIKRTGLGWLVRDAGYRALFAGKQHFPKYKAQDIGFDVLTTDERDELASVTEQFLAAPGDQPFVYVASFINPHDICYMAIRDAASDERERKLVERGVVECEELDKALQRPPGMDDEEFYRKYCPPLPDNFAPQEDEPQAFRDMLDPRPFRRWVRENWSAERWREHRWAYHRLTERVDGQIQRVLDALEKSPAADNTIVIFTSDHGDMDAAHGFEHKSLFYDESSRIPLIIAGPGVDEGRVDTTHMMSNGLDLVPTICDLIGADVPEELQGASWQPLFREGDAKQADWHPVAPMVNEIGHAVVSPTHKYAKYDWGENAEQLWDHTNDPGETRNAASDANQQDALEQHRRWFADVWPDVLA